VRGTSVAAFPAVAPWITQSRNQHGTARAVKIRLGKIQCLAVPERGATATRSGHTAVPHPDRRRQRGDDLLDHGRIG
jgi:hypothetical protein